MSRSKFQSHSIEIEDFRINPINPFNPISTKGGVEILKLLLGMSYNRHKMSRSKFQSHSIEIDDFIMNPINPFNPMSTKGGSENGKLISKNVL